MSIKFTIDGLDQEIKRLEKLQPVLDQEVMKALNLHGVEWEKDLRNNTPVAESYSIVVNGRSYRHTGGKLRQNMKFLGVEKVGKTFISTTANNLEYAKYVEFGHQQTPGRYVPVLGKRLVKDRVPGQYIMTNARERAIQKLPGAIRRAIKEAEDELNE